MGKAFASRVRLSGSTSSPRRPTVDQQLALREPPRSPAGRGRTRRPRRPGPDVDTIGGEEPIAARAPAMSCRSTSRPREEFDAGHIDGARLIRSPSRAATRGVPVDRALVADRRGPSAPTPTRPSTLNTAGRRAQRCGEGRPFPV